MTKTKTARQVALAGCFVLDEKKATTYSPGFYPSTIGAGGLNFSVRDGKRWAPPPKSPQGL
jgi:hypothetical protein